MHIMCDIILVLFSQALKGHTLFSLQCNEDNNYSYIESEVSSAPGHYCGIVIINHNNYVQTFWTKGKKVII